MIHLPNSIYTTNFERCPQHCWEFHDRLWEALSGTISEKKKCPQPYWGGDNSGNALEASNALNYRVWGIPAVLSTGIPGNALRAFPGSFRKFFRNFCRKVPAVLGVYTTNLYHDTAPICIAVLLQKVRGRWHTPNKRAVLANVPSFQLFVLSFRVCTPVPASGKPRIRLGCPSRSTFSQTPRKLLLVDFGRKEYGYRTSRRGV